MRILIVTIRDFLTVGYFVLAIYAFAGGVVQGYVIFPDWKLIRFFSGP